MKNTGWTAFAGQRILKAGAPWEVALVVKDISQSTEEAGPVLIFDDATGRTVDFDPRGSKNEVVARIKASFVSQEDDAPRTRGRPRLGVVSKEVTLLPRHWEWLAKQPSGGSATLRKLVENAMRVDHGTSKVRNSQAAADCYMAAMLGNMPHYEEASRALYNSDRESFMCLTEPWPADLRDYARRLAEPAVSGC